MRDTCAGLGWWQGDYGHVIGGWLPANYVEEVGCRLMSCQAVPTVPCRGWRILLACFVPCFSSRLSRLVSLNTNRFCHALSD